MDNIKFEYQRQYDFVPNTFEKASLCSKIFFYWTNDLIKKGGKLAKKNEYIKSNFIKKKFFFHSNKFN